MLATAARSPAALLPLGLKEVVHMHDRRAVDRRDFLGQRALAGAAAPVDGDHEARPVPEFVDPPEHLVEPLVYGRDHPVGGMVGPAVGFAVRWRWAAPPSVFGDMGRAFRPRAGERAQFPIKGRLPRGRPGRGEDEARGGFPASENRADARFIRTKLTPSGSNNGTSGSFFVWLNSCRSAMSVSSRLQDSRPGRRPADGSA